MKKTFYILFLVLLIIGCTPQKRLENLLKNNSGLLVTDTITVKDIIVTKTIDTVNVITVDSFLKIDTLTLTKERLTVQIIRVNDSIFIKGKCGGDTVIVYKKIPYQKAKGYTPDKLDELIDVLPYIAFALIAISIASILRYKK